MTIAVLASGSSGNALVVSAGGTHLVVDAGVSARRLVGGLDDLGIATDDVAAVLVTHEHHDHVSGVGPVSRRLGVPVVATRGTHRALHSRLGRECIGVTVTAGSPLGLAGLEVRAFSTSHDCSEPVGYTVSDGATTLAVATDLGVMTPHVHERLAAADCVVLESNHDEKMLVDGRYPWHLKRRIMGRLGHLSNAAAAAELRSLAGSRLSLVILAHLSDENNDPSLAADVALEALEDGGLPDVGLHVASQRSMLGPLEIATPGRAEASSTKMETAWRR